MKKNLLLFVFVFATTFFTGSAGTNHYSSAEEENADMFLSYAWYLDPELTYPTGTYRDVNEEMDDLRETYPTNTFSAYYSPSLGHWEYGYRPGWPIKLIYSDLAD